jgi:hypothetical protein
MFAGILFLVACEPVEDTELGASAQRTLDQIGLLVDAHVADVRAATELHEVVPLEALHADQMANFLDDLQVTMDEMMDCGMSSGMMDGMLQADMHENDMMDEVTEHGASVDEHQDIEACWAAEDAYGEGMHGHMDAMWDELGDFDADAQCSSGHHGRMGM